jgi:bifunctional N-acetylglucosamine-1-phosphate-uridyltransferase/glucosamine-1-phosphate-acetyltransferase GlmU-like protein
VPDHLRPSDFIGAWSASPFAAADDNPWQVTRNAEELILAALETLGPEYRIERNCALHESVTVEGGAVLKGPLIIGAGCLVAAGAYLRGGVYLADDCIVGPACELKTTFMFPGSKVAHLSFVGDSLLGSGVNVEAGAMIANYRNERDDKRIRIHFDGATIDTGVDKFGSLVGDRCRIGANAVIAPGALLRPGTRVGRLTLVDQSADS